MGYFAFHATWLMPDNGAAQPVSAYPSFSSVIKTDDFEAEARR
ncbi:hypothetical protein [Paenibacillus sp. y28]